MKCALCGEPCSPWFHGDDLCDGCWAWLERKRQEKELEQRRIEEDMKKANVQYPGGAVEG